MPVLRSGQGTSPGSFGMTPLHAAAKGGHIDVVHLLIEYGADVEATVAGNLRPLHFANNECVVMALVRHGSSIHPQGKSEVSPLTYVLTTKPHLSAVRCLLQLGCNPNSATSLGFTAADAAVQTGNVEALQLLLNAGLDVSPSISGNNSLIYKAIYCCQNEPPDLTLRLIGLLLGHEISGKGNPQSASATSTHDTKHPWGSWTPFLRVFQQRPSLFVGLLLNAKDAPIGYEIQDADRYLSMAYSLIEHGASLDVHRESSMLLKFFLDHEDDFPQTTERIYMFLLDRLAGVPISHGKDPVARQPIHLLFTRRYSFFDTDTNAVISLRILERLLHLGADPNEPDSGGNTPLALLCQLPVHTHENQKLYISEASRLLVDHGAITSSERKRTLLSAG
ncbi:hypothetical protein CEP54_002834 [Fusarium duplospermum]|uniref:Uncharacterized protein n=1 Tax=Fusarium duplospermum TaxID=1325734 RepID=A0A428QSS3_9HYPO|nr:hypothetical protein CEP54_002834 [Fusarium duplospermum]